MRRWLSLTREEQRLLISAVAYLTAAIVGVRVAGIRRMLKWADRPTASGPAQKKVAERADYAELVQAMERAGRSVPGAGCLPQSLALARILRRRGVAADVRIGAKTAGGFHAHAWVEVGGIPLTRVAGHQALTRSITPAAERLSL